jgi:CRP/FNR family transcriptional regulator, cyclic AMP receptor protein
MALGYWGFRPWLRPMTSDPMRLDATSVAPTPREPAHGADTGRSSHMTEHSAIIAGQPFLRGMTPGQIERLAAMARHVRIPAGDRLFEEGTTARSFWLIDAGRVALDVLVPGDGRVIIETLGRGDVVGLSWLQPPCQFRYGAVILQPLQAFEFDAADVKAACDADPVLGYALLSRFMAVAARRLQATRARLFQAHTSAA